MLPCIRKIHSVTYHRNGITGAPFHVVAFTPRGGSLQLLAAVFDAPGDVAIVNPDHPEDRFCGEVFEHELRAAIARAFDLDLVGYAGKVGEPLPARDSSRTKTGAV